MCKDAFGPTYEILIEVERVEHKVVDLLEESFLNLAAHRQLVGVDIDLS